MTDNPSPQTPAKRWAGKYDSPEALEQGYANLVPAFEQIKQEARADRQRADELSGQVKLLTEALTQTAPVTPPSLERLDEGEIQRYIDARLAPVEKKLDAIPGQISSTLRSVLEPLTQVQNAKSTYLSENQDYDDGAIQKFLAMNPGINKTYQTILSTGSENAGQAFKYAHDCFKNANPTKSAVNTDAKRDAGVPNQSPGPPVEIPGEGPSAGDLAQRSILAQTVGGVPLELDYFKEHTRGSRLLEAIESMKPDWARE